MDIDISPTRDASLLAQYYLLRERTFRRELGLAGFQGGEESWDWASDIVVARKGKRCIGGARITASTPERRQNLPLEADGMHLSSALPSLQLPVAGYAQVTRLAIDERERTPQLLQHFGAALVTHARRVGCDYLIGVSGMARSRIYRRIFRAQGLNYRINHEYVLPVAAEFAGLPHVLGFVTLRNKDCSVRAHVTNEDDGRVLQPTAIDAPYRGNVRISLDIGASH